MIEGGSEDKVAGQVRTRYRWSTRLLVLLVVLSAMAAVLLGLRTYRTFAVLVSAYEVGVPQASRVRPWMTLGYVAAAYGTPEPALRERLGVTTQIGADTTLKMLADRAGIPRLDYVQRVQRAIAELSPAPTATASSAGPPKSAGWSEDLVAAVLVYGYPALALTLFLGALGAPLPSGLMMIVAGSLATQGHLTWLELAVVATAASVAGDLAGYGIGRMVGGSFLERRGRWVGLTPERRARVEQLFVRWGALAVVLSRSLVSVLISAVNLVAGAGAYRLLAFLVFGVVGRLAWTSAYLGLGYVAASGLEFEPAADFLRSLTGLLIAVTLLCGAWLALRRRSPWPSLAARR